tara:strand:- start:41 stop:223 length:183 start_codon:yes stop_codon:yes gene_type:complete
VNKMSILVADISFYTVDDNGDEILNSDGTLKLYQIKDGVRFKPLEYLCEDMDIDIVEEIK